jgi:hypothetical protein
VIARWALVVTVTAALIAAAFVVDAQPRDGVYRVGYLGTMSANRDARPIEVVE